MNFKWINRIWDVLKFDMIELEVMPAQYFCGYCRREMRIIAEMWRVECQCGAKLKFEELILQKRRHGNVLFGELSKAKSIDSDSWFTTTTGDDIKSLESGSGMPRAKPWIQK